MYKIIFLLCLLCSPSIFAQSIKATLIDSETKDPITQIAVISDDESFFAITNDKGEVLLPEDLVNQTIFVDDYLYVYEEKTLHSTEDFVWELQPNSETLEELLIYNNPKSVLQEVIDNSIQSFSINTGLEAYFRSRGAVTSYSKHDAEAIVNVYMQPDNEVDIAVVQSKAKEEFNEEQKNQVSPSAGLTHPRENFSQALRFGILVEMLDMIKQYEINITSKKVGDSTIHTCYFSPKEKSKKKMLFSGYFTYDADKKIVLEVKCETPQEKIKYNKVNVVIFSIRDMFLDYHVKYVMTDKLYYPTLCEYNIQAQLRSRLASIDSNLNFTNEFYILSDKPKATAPDQILNENPLTIGDRYSEPFWNDPRIQNHE
ncbi:MAG TPA: hypothetical protein VKY32_03975 [Flavobacterium sp.]|nr:hypothetical protein [Flavobacterium sp.]